MRRLARGGGPIRPRHPIEIEEPIPHLATNAADECDEHATVHCCQFHLAEHSARCRVLERLSLVPIGPCGRARWKRRSCSRPALSSLATEQLARLADLGAPDA